MAPFAPFMAEELYQNLVVTIFPDAPDSVHLADFPVADEDLIDRQLSDDIRLAMRLSSLGRAARSQAGIKVRQPLAEVVRKLAIAEQTYSRWRNEYGGLRVDQAKRLKELEKENARLKKLVADQALDHAILKEVASGNF